MGRAAALLAVLAAVTAVAAGCGDEGRDAVERYIEQANAVQQGSQADVQAANETYARFAAGDLDAADADARLTAAEQSIRDTRERLARIEPPPEAVALHRRLLEVYELNAEFASESTRLGRYLPAARAALRPLARIGERLRVGLRDAETPEHQAAALTRYATGVSGRLDRMRTLDPPPVLLPTHRVQLARLASSARLARELRRASLDRDSRRVARLLVRFRRVSRRSGDSRLTQEAVRRYNERYREISRAVGRTQREQVRLQQRYT